MLPLMRRGLLFLTVAVFLTGCETTPVHELSYSEQQAWAKKIMQRCIDQGVKLGTPQMQDCLTVEARRDAAIRYNNAMRAQRAQMALADGLQGMGDSYSRAASTTARMNSTVTCTSVPAPAGYVKARCY